MSKKQTEQVPGIKSWLFLFFLILLAGITNTRYQPALDSELEIRMLTLSIFLFVVILFHFFNKQGRFDVIDWSVFKNPFIILYGLYLVVTGISVFVAHNTAEALHEFLKLSVYFALFLYLILYVLPKENSRNLFLKAAVIYTVIISFTGLVQGLQIFSEHGFSVESAYMIKGNSAHKSIFAEVLFLGFALSCFSIYQFRGIFQKAALFGAILSLALIVAIVTRAVWLAFIVSLFFTLIAYMLFLRKNIKAGSLRKALLISFGAVVLAGGTGYYLFTKLDTDNTVKEHIEEALDFQSGNTYHRLNIWKKSIPIIKEHPLLGVGAGNWKIEVAKYDVILHNDTQGWIVPRRTHNDYINVITETGIVGLLLFLGMFFMILYFSVCIMRKSESREDKMFALALFFAVVGYMVFSAFNFTKERIESQIILNAIFAFAFYTYWQQKKEKSEKVIRKKHLRLSVAATFIVLFFAGFSSYERIQSEKGVHAMFAYSKSKNPRAGQIAYQSVKDLRSPFVSLSPMNDPLLALEAIALLNLNENKHKIAELYEKALNDFPYHVKTLNELAYVYSGTEQYDKAAYYSSLAYQYAPSNLKVVLDHVIHLKQAGKDNEAFEVLTTIDPQNRNQRYRAVMHTFLTERIRLAVQKSGNKLIVETARKIVQNKSTLYNIYLKSIENQVAFEKEFFERLLVRIKKENPKTDIQSLQNPIFIEYGIELK